MPQVQRGEQQRQQQQLIYCMSSYCEEQDDEEFAPGMIEPAYERVALDAESEATVNRLRDDDEVIVFMPAEETVIPDGPKRCVLCFLLGGNHRAAKRINDFAEEHKAWTQVGELGLFVGILALLEVIPLSLTWLSVLSLGDTCRCFFLLNARAVKMCISESVDFMVPFVSIIVGLLAGAASWDFHPGVCAFAICFGGFYITQILFADADIRERFIRDGGSLMPVYAVAFLVILALYLTFALGGFPSTTDREITFTFLKSEIRIGTMSIWTRFMSIPVIILAKFVFKLWRHGSMRTLVIKIPLARNVVRKGDLEDFLRRRQQERDALWTELFLSWQRSRLQ
mmetsp:Transcript_12558/g.34158  ORF Transcript_12558/g.34158 Transcript_12558/m.34158 type:complete len:340 (+) Transcript_12558:2-1021(+)